MNTITRHRGFTLIELLVVISIIVLVSLGAIPTVRKLLQAQTGAQAASLFSAQLSAARAEAIVSGKYTALHSQLSNRTDDTQDQCFLAVLSLQSDSGNSGLAMAPGHVPLPVPGNQAYGRIGGSCISGTTFSNISDLPKFTTLTVLFDRQGQVTPLMNTTSGLTNTKMLSSGLFTTSGTASGTALWTKSVDMPGAYGACVFDYKKLSLLESDKRGDYLDANARILPINTYTGSLFDME